MFGAYKYRDQIAMQDTGYLQAFSLVSASSVYYTGSAAVSTFQSVNNFAKLVYRLYVPLWKNSTSTSSFCHSAVNLYLASLNSTYNPGNTSSSASSISSNWALLDSLNATAQLTSSAMSASSLSATWVAMIDYRPEKYSISPPYITPVVATDSNAAGSAVLALCALTCDAYFTDYQPASNFDSATIVAVETDYL